MTSWRRSGPGSVVKRALTKYRRRPKPAIVVGTSKEGGVYPMWRPPYAAWVPATEPCADLYALVRSIDTDHPDVVVTDILMPAAELDEGDQKLTTLAAPAALADALRSSWG